MRRLRGSIRLPAARRCGGPCKAARDRGRGSILSYARSKSERSKIEARADNRKFHGLLLKYGTTEFLSCRMARASRLMLESIRGAHLRDLFAADPQALAEFPPRARQLAARFLAPANFAEDPGSAARSRACGEVGGADRRDVSRRSDQRHRGARGAACRVALGFRGLGSDPSGGQRLAQQALELRRRGAPWR